YCTNLSKESMLNIFNGLCDEVSKTITVSRNAFNINFPTDEEKEEIYDFLSDVKGWSFSLG
ncbi:MAG: hypothetical protein KBT46_00535, partial [Ruminococcus sp.]|nr:hypothetical protein [Candidatus Copronaster equi]